MCLHLLLQKCQISNVNQIGFFKVKFLTSTTFYTRQQIYQELVTAILFILLASCRFYEALLVSV